MRWTGQIFWLLAYEEVERFVVERLREIEKPFLLNSQPINGSTGLAPSSRLHRPAVAGRLALGKSYPVTAAQLLPVYTGFLAPTHFFKLAKN
jgi:hypothetical protein